MSGEPANRRLLADVHRAGHPELLAVGEAAGYADLYERAPVAYLSIAGDGTVRQANRAAAVLLEIDRPHLIGRDFAVCVDPAARDTWSRHAAAVLDAREKQVCHLTLRRRSGALLHCRLESVAVDEGGSQAAQASPLAGHGGQPAQDGQANGQPAAAILRTCLIDLTDLRPREEALLRENEQLRQRAAEQAAALQSSQDWIRSLLDAASDAIITIDHLGAIIDTNLACQRMFAYPDAALTQQSIALLLPQASDTAELTQLVDRPRPDPMRSHWTGRRSTGHSFPAEVTVTEIDHRHVFLVIVRDVTERKELERQVLEASSGEQRRIAQDLHDELGQELTGLRYMTLNLVEALTSCEGGLDDHDIAAALAQRIASGIASAQQHLRGAIRGIMPVDVDAEGLEAALRTLAERTNRYGKLVCRFLCNKPVPLEDNAVATQLYRIAQEAVTNAVKHGHADNIQIRLESDAESVTLSVSDDGPGIDVHSSLSAGWGLRIMQYRAGLIDAELKVQRNEPRGTVILCTLLTRR